MFIFGTVVCILNGILSFCNYSLKFLSTVSLFYSFLSSILNVVPYIFFRIWFVGLKFFQPVYILEIFSFPSIRMDVLPGVLVSSGLHILRDQNALSQVVCLPEFLLKKISCYSDEIFFIFDLKFFRSFQYIFFVMYTWYFTYGMPWVFSLRLLICVSVFLQFGDVFYNDLPKDLVYAVNLRLFSLLHA